MKYLAKILYEEHIKTFHSDSMHVFTDGSKSEQGGSCAFVLGNNKQCFKLSSQATIYTAELYAILQVLQNIENSKITENSQFLRFKVLYR